MKHVCRFATFSALSKTIQESLQTSTLNDTNQDHHDRENQEDVNEPAHGVRSDKTQEPEDKQDNCDGSKHFFLLLLSVGGW